MLRIGICDDEEAMREALRSQVERWFSAHGYSFSIVLFEDGAGLLESAFPFSLVFLDIAMPGETGMEIARRFLNERGDCAFIFITVLKEYVFDAFEVRAVDYLIKPVAESRLSRALERFCTHYIHTGEKSLLVKTGGAVRTVPVRDILYCEVVNRKVYLHLQKETIDYYCKIESLEEQLGEGFFRCHRSYLINLSMVCGYENGLAILENGEKIPVSRLRSQDFTEAILESLKRRGEPNARG